MKKRLSAMVVSVTLLFASNVIAATIVNGSFEDISGMTESSNGSFADGIPVGWSFTGNQVQILKSPPFQPSGVDGSRYVEMFQNPDFGTLSQTVTGLTIGLGYDLSFLWGNRIFDFDFTVEMGGGSFSASGSGLLDMVAESFFFTANATNVALNITWNDPGSTSVSGALDAFVLTEAVAPIPLPAAFPLFVGGVGLLGILGWRRKRIAAA